MKYTFTKTWAFVALLALTVGCSKEQINPEVLKDSAFENGSISAVAGHYTIVYESKVANNDNTWTYTWSIQNEYPSSENKDLSHWAMDLGSCVTIDNVTRAVEGADTTKRIDMEDVDRVFQPDPSMNIGNNTDQLSTCNFVNPVFKFKRGTEGKAKSYYSITLNKNVNTADVTGYYKSGAGVGCGSFTFTGLGCEIISKQSYSFSQGYWFARPSTVWPGDAEITIADHTYTQEQGRAIWNTSNKKGLLDAKACFLQVAAIKLSDKLKPGNNAAGALSSEIATIELFLKPLGKLVANSLPKAANADAKAAAGRISAWIAANHADSTFGN